MKKILVVTLVVTMLFMVGNVAATTVDVAYTADNIADTWFVQGDMGIASNLAAGDNRADWQTADKLSLDLEANSHYTLVWSVTNLGDFSDGNPAGFLAEIDLGDELVVTDLNWKYFTYGFNTSDFDASTWNWQNVTGYGYNGGDNIWTNVKGSAIEGISTDAQWIWSDLNFGAGEYQNLFIRADIKTAPVPEPATLLLLGSGLVGLAFLKRRKK